MWEAGLTGNVYPRAGSFPPQWYGLLCGVLGHQEEVITGRDGAWPFRDGVGLRSKRPVRGFESNIPGWTGPVLGRVLKEGGVAIPLCAAAPGGGGQRAFGLLVLASCFFQGTPGRFLILGARFSLK